MKKYRKILENQSGVNACVSLNNMPRLQAAGERWRQLEWKGRQLREWVVANEGCQPHFGAVGCCHVVVLGIDHGDPGKTWHRRAGTVGWASGGNVHRRAPPSHTGPPGEALVQGHQVHPRRRGFPMKYSVIE